MNRGGQIEVGPVKVSADSSRGHQWLIVGHHVLNHPKRFGVILQEYDFLIKAHVGKLGFDTTVSDADVEPE
jgi:hypothetical protein